MKFFPGPANPLPGELAWETHKTTTHDSKSLCTVNETIRPNSDNSTITLSFPITISLPWLRRPQPRRNPSHLNRTPLNRTHRDRNHQDRNHWNWNHWNRIHQSPDQSRLHQNPLHQDQPRQMRQRLNSFQPSRSSVGCLPRYKPWSFAWLQRNTHPLCPSY